MSLDQVHNMEMVLEWVKACPFKYRISSYQGGAIAVRVDVPEHEWSVDDGQHYETEQPNYKVDVQASIKEEKPHEYCVGCECILRWDESEKYCRWCEERMEKEEEKSDGSQDD